MMFSYELIRSDRKTLGLQVKDGRVIVRAPRRVTQKQIDAFVLGMKSIVRMPLESILQMLCVVHYVLNGEKLELSDLTVPDPMPQQRGAASRIPEEAPHNTLAVEETCDLHIHNRAFAMVELLHLLRHDVQRVHFVMLRKQQRHGQSHIAGAGNCDLHIYSSISNEYCSEFQRYCWELTQ